MGAAQATPPNGGVPRKGVHHSANGGGPLQRGMARPRGAPGDMGAAGYSTQSAMKTFVSPTRLPFRFEANTSFRPSGENIGNPSKPS